MAGEWPLVWGCVCEFTRGRCKRVWRAGTCLLPPNTPFSAACLWVCLSHNALPPRSAAQCSCTSAAPWGWRRVHMYRSRFTCAICLQRWEGCVGAPYHSSERTAGVDRQTPCQAACAGAAAAPRHACAGSFDPQASPLVGFGFGICGLVCLYVAAGGHANSNTAVPTVCVCVRARSVPCCFAPECAYLTSACTRVGRTAGERGAPCPGRVCFLACRAARGFSGEPGVCAAEECCTVDSATGQPSVLIVCA